MSDTPKFTVVDRRKFRGEEESSQETSGVVPSHDSDAAPKPSGTAAPRLTLVEPLASKAEAETSAQAVAVAEEPEAGSFDSAVSGVASGSAIGESEIFDDSQLPPAPTDEESRLQKLAYDQAAERLDTLVRAQNPAIPAPESIGFEHLVQQLYLSAMMQMGAGTPEGQRPRIDILGARQTIDLLGVVQAKSAGNLNADETRAIDTVLFELRHTFLELTRMISAQAAAPMPPPPGSKPGPGGFGPKR
jgi:hypothetical protein